MPEDLESKGAIASDVLLRRLETEDSDGVKGKTCPFCQNTGISSDGPSWNPLDQNQVWVNVTCVRCKKAWLEIYRLESAEELIKDNESPYDVFKRTGRPCPWDKIINDPNLFA